MRLSAAVGHVLGLSLTGLMAQGAAAQTAPPAGAGARPARSAAAKPVATTFDAVHAGKYGAGMAVDFPVVLLPETAIQNTVSGTVRYYALAVRKDGPYMTASAAVLAEARAAGTEMVREIPTVIRDDKRYRQLIDGLDDLLKRAFDVPLGVEETVAVELPGLDGVASAYDWETVKDPNAPTFPRFEPLSLSQFGLDYATSIDAVKVRRDLMNLSLAQPPAMDKPLPQMKLSPGFKFTSQVDLDNYNAAVDLYNAERLRRRVYVVERTQADFQLAVDRLESRLGQAAENLGATVLAPPPSAKLTFSRIYKGKTPPAFVRERGKPEASLVRRALAATTVQVCSYPIGAKVRLDGREVGTTPYLARALPAGSKLQLVVASAGAAPHEAQETVPMKPLGVKRFDYKLVAAEPRLLAEDEAKRLFDPAFKPTKAFTLAIAAPAFTPLPKAGKETKEQKKEREERNRSGTKLAEYVDSMRKATSDPAGPFSSWYRLVPAGEADAVVEIEEIPLAERDPKYKDLYTHRVRSRLSGDPAGKGSDEKISPWVAKPTTPLETIAARLKNERWQRALGIE